MNFIDWAISKAKIIQVSETPIEYNGKFYRETIKIFHGRMNPGRVRQLREEFGTVPVNEEFRSVTCKWGGNYISEAGKVMVSEVTFEEII